MDDKTQKGRLEQELRFLKESFEAEVISKEEFEKGRNRIEKKINEMKHLLDEPVKEQHDEEPYIVYGEQIIKEEESAEGQKEELSNTVDVKNEPATEDAKNFTENMSQSNESKEKIEEEIKAEEPKKEVAIEAKKEEKIKLRVIQDDGGLDEHFEHAQVMVDTQEKAESSTLLPPEKPEEDATGQKQESKFFKYAVVFVVLALVVFFSYSFLKNKYEIQEKAVSGVEFVAACSSNEDCKQEGKEGFCLDPATKEAKCEFKEIPKINIMVLNNKRDCFNCDAQRILNILESWFGSINAEEINYNTDKGKALAEEFNASMLPMYILDENIVKQPKFEQFKQIFVKKGSSYVLSGDAAASSFYANRDNIPNKLDLFVIQGDANSIKAEKNLKEFLDNFGNVKFEKQLAGGKLAEEFGIKSFPTFLVNNLVKFSGVHTADTIKSNFCKLNDAQDCNKTLSKSLV